MLPGNLADIGAMAQWIGWERVHVVDKDGVPEFHADGSPRVSKKPRTTRGTHAKEGCHAECTGQGGITGTNATHQATWRTYAEVRAEIERRPGIAGVGFVFPLDGSLVGIDLDHVIDADGAIKPEADAIVEEIGSYAEWSPSGTGIHILCRGTLPSGGRKRGSVEMYSTGRFFTFTGRGYGRFGDMPIRDASEAVLAVHAREFSPPAAVGHLPIVATGTLRPDEHDRVDDDELLRQMFASPRGEDIERIFNGGGGDDTSAVDLALCNHLRYWCNGDRLRVDALFRRSGRMRPKWDEVHYGDGRTYGQGTLDKAFTGIAMSRGTVRVEVARATASVATAATDVTSTPFTDLGNAERLVRRHGRDIRWVPDWKAWLVWNGRYWERDTNGAIMRLMFEVVRAIPDEADDEGTRKFAARSEGLQRLGAAIEVAKSLPGIAIRSDALNQNRDIVVVRDGTVELRTRTVREHRREDLVTTVMLWDGELAWYDDRAACPTWLASLATWQPDGEILAFLQMLAGYALTGHVRERNMVIFWGIGRNGKSTFVEALRATFGDHAHQSSTDLVMQRRGADAGQATPELAVLQGKRLVVMDETSEGGRLDEARVKWITGGDSISARRLYGDPFTFQPTHTIILTTNHRPVIRSGGEAIWDRIQQVPWNTRIEDAQLDRSLPQKLLDERPGILSWIVMGASMWYEYGLTPPASVKSATDDYRADSDWFGLWMDECCVVGDAQMATSKDLHRAYDTWATEAGERDLSIISLGRILSERGFKQARDRRGRRAWQGIGVRADLA
jgi:putative DNA primase/helicase